MNTEISEHAKEAAKKALSGELINLVEAIQRGINLAVESKDKEIRKLTVLLLESRPLNVRLDEEVRSKDRRIAELESYLTTNEKRFDFAQLQQQLADAKETVQSKDREIERLTMDYGCLLSRLTEELRETRRLTAQLTEANAKLAEAEKELSIEHRLIQIEELRSKDREISELKTVAREMVSELDREIKRIQKEWDASEKARASNLSQLSSAQAEIERLKAVPCCSGNFACGGICPICNAITTGNQ